MTNHLNFQCPKCKQGEVTKSSADSFVCGQCNASYPVAKDIPRFVPADNYANSFGFQWNLHRLTQLDSYTGIPISTNRVKEIIDIDSSWEGQTVLEAGSGSGRFTEVLAATKADLYTFDYSRAVEANAENNKKFPNVKFFQGDIFHIPFPEKTFDKVVCIGVIQHTPDPEKAFKSLTKHVKPGGSIIIDVYSRRLRDVIHWKTLLRPLTRHLPILTVYKFCEKIVPLLLPPTMALRRTLGAAGTRLSPVPDYSNLGLPYDLNKKWSILDTFDIYSPKYDSPQTLKDVKRWFKEAGYESFEVRYGINGIVGKGTLPKAVRT